MCDNSFQNQKENYRVNCFCIPELNLKCLAGPHSYGENNFVKNFINLIKILLRSETGFSNNHRPINTNWIMGDNKTPISYLQYFKL